MDEYREKVQLRYLGSRQSIRAGTLIQAATLGESVRNFLYGAFLDVARHQHPPMRHPDGKHPPPPQGTASGCHRIEWGRRLVGHPKPTRTATGRTPYRDPDMKLPPSHIPPDEYMAWERETWADRVAS